MNKLVKFTFLALAFGFLASAADSVMAQGRYGKYRQERQEARREYRREVREARREYREDLRDARKYRNNRYYNNGYYNNGYYNNGYYNNRYNRRNGYYNNSRRVYRSQNGYYTVRPTRRGYVVRQYRRY